VSIVLLAAFFRLYMLTSIPPGLHIDEAAYGIKALNALNKVGALPISGTESPSQLFLFLETLGVRLWGNTILALRIIPAVLSIGSALAIYAWGRRWFDERAALFAGFFMAVIPWAVSFGRLGYETGLTLVLVPTLFWLIGKAVSKSSLPWALGAGCVLALVIGLDKPNVSIGIGILLIGGLYWRQLIRQHASMRLALLGGAVIGLLGGALLWLPHLSKLTFHLQSIWHYLNNLAQIMLMLNYQGDPDFRNNFNALPMLNLFVGLMFLLGLLLCVMRWRQWRYGSLLVLLAVSLLPAIFTSELPTARNMLVALPSILMLAAVGVDYMLTTWYKTFPINSAARGLGTLPVMVLLALTIYQGHQQYFVAWAKSPEVYEGYNERAVAIAGYMIRNSFEGDRYGVLDDYDNTVVGYLTHDKAAYLRLGPNDAGVLPKDDQSKQFIITAELSDEYLQKLKETYPKARLSQQYSQHNDDNELFAIYEVLK
jgi:uncharacterized membrane protein